MSSSEALAALDDDARLASSDAAPASAASDIALRLAADMQRAAAEGRPDLLTPEALQALVAAACRVYSAQNEAGNQFLPLPDRGSVMDTDVMVMTSALLRAVNLQVFELGMWQSWTGR